MSSTVSRWVVRVLLAVAFLAIVVQVLAHMPTLQAVATLVGLAVICSAAYLVGYSDGMRWAMSIGTGSAHWGKR